MTSGHALYLCQVSWNYLERYQSYRVDTISIQKITKGNNSAKNVGGVTVVYLCTSSGHALYFYQVLWNYLKRYQSYRADTISILKITKGNNSAKNVGGVTVADLCTLSGHALYFYQLLWNYLKRYQSYRADTISIVKITKGNNSAKNVGGVKVVDLCTLSGHVLHFYQVLWNYLKRYQSYRADTISIQKISKGNNSAKNVGGVTVVNLCTSSDHALYLCQVLWNYLEWYQSYWADTNDQPLTDGRTARLAGKYRSREFPAVITGNYRPGKYSKFWQSGKYWEIWHFKAVWTKRFCNISKNLSWKQIFLIAYVLIMQISYKIPRLVHARGHSRWFVADSQVLSYHLSSLFQHCISKHKILHHLVLIH